MLADPTNHSSDNASGVWHSFEDKSQSLTLSLTCVCVCTCILFKSKCNYLKTETAVPTVANKIFHSTDISWSQYCNNIIKKKIYLIISYYTHALYCQCNLMMLKICFICCTFEREITPEKKPSITFIGL